MTDRLTTTEVELDCLTCGACCRSGHDGRILIPPEDLLRWRAIGRDDIARAIQPGHFGLEAFATRPDGAAPTMLAGVFLLAMGLARMGQCNRQQAMPLQLSNQLGNAQRPPFSADRR